MSQFHRGHMAPISTPLQQFDTHNMALGWFRATVELRGLGPLSDALVAQRRWSSPADYKEALFLLDAVAPKEDDEVKGEVEVKKMTKLNN
jgi:hypothetical protein